MFHEARLMQSMPHTTNALGRVECSPSNLLLSGEMLNVLLTGGHLTSLLFPYMRDSCILLSSCFSSPVVAIPSVVTIILLHVFYFIQIYYILKTLNVNILRNPAFCFKSGKANCTTAIFLMLLHTECVLPIEFVLQGCTISKLFGFVLFNKNNSQFSINASILWNNIF